jgi:hypothetical protein
MSSSKYLTKNANNLTYGALTENSNMRLNGLNNVIKTKIKKT